MPGDTTAGGLARLPAELARTRPAVVVLELGGNDGLQGLPLEQMHENLDRMIRLARAAGARVLLIGVRLPPNYGSVYTGRFHDVYASLARSADVALVPEILRGIAEHREMMQPDGLHPKASAEPAVLDNVWPALRALLGRPAAAGGRSANAPARGESMRR